MGIKVTKHRIMKIKFKVTSLIFSRCFLLDILLMAQSSCRLRLVRSENNMMTMKSNILTAPESP